MPVIVFYKKTIVQEWHSSYGMKDYQLTVACIAMHVTLDLRFTIKTFLTNVSIWESMKTVLEE